LRSAKNHTPKAIKASTPEYTLYNRRPVKAESKTIETTVMGRIIKTAAGGDNTGNRIMKIPAVTAIYGIIEQRYSGLLSKTKNPARIR
jgi:hypothetical protein